MCVSIKWGRWVGLGVLIGAVGLLSACTPEKFILARLADGVPVFMVCDPVMATSVEIGTGLSNNYEVRWALSGIHSFDAGDSIVLGASIDSMKGAPPQSVDLDLNVRVAIKESRESGSVATTVAIFGGGKIHEDGWITQTRDLGDVPDPCSAAKG